MSPQIVWQKSDRGNRHVLHTNDALLGTLPYTTYNLSKQMNGLSPCCQTNTRPCVTYPLMDITNRQFSSRYTLNSPTLSAYTFKISSACCVPPPISKPIGFSKHFTQASMIWEPRPCSCSALLEPMSLSTYRKTVAPLAEALLRLCGARDA